MQLTTRRAVSPIIATLLLIAIAVAAGIIVYVFTSSIAGNLTQQGGQQVSEQISMDAYSFPSAGTAPVFVLRNIGSTSVSMSQIFFDGTLCQATTFLCSYTTITTAGSCTTAVANTVPVVCPTGAYTSITLALSAAQTTGTSHIVRIVTADGGTFTFSIIAGRSG
jgi:flagellin-like protein